MSRVASRIQSYSVLKQQHQDQNSKSNKKTLACEFIHALHRFYKLTLGSSWYQLNTSTPIKLKIRARGGKICFVMQQVALRRKFGSCSTSSGRRTSCMRGTPGLPYTITYGTRSPTRGSKRRSYAIIRLTDRKRDGDRNNICYWTVTFVGALYFASKFCKYSSSPFHYFNLHMNTEHTGS